MNEWAFSMFTFTKLVLVLIWASVVILLRASDGSEHDHGRSRRYLSWLRMLFGTAALIVSAVLLFLERHNPSRSSSPPQHLRHTYAPARRLCRPPLVFDRRPVGCGRLFEPEYYAALSLFASAAIVATGLLAQARAGHGSY